MSTISASTTSTTAFKVTSDTTGTLVFQTGASPTTAMSISSSQIISFTNPPTATGGGSVSTNTAYGTSALAANTTGASNSAYGYQALKSVTTNADNSAFGTNAMRDTSTGGANSAFGSAALIQNTTGSNNVAVGQAALFSNTTASNNTAVGYQAGYSATGTCPDNTVIGYQAGYYLANLGGYNTFVGAYAGLNVTTGQENQFFGRYAGQLVTTGSKNTIIGKYSGNQGGLDIRTASNYIVLSDGDGNPRGFCDNIGQWSFWSGSASATLVNTRGSAGDAAYQAILISKYDNNSTTSQNFIQFQINNGAANCGKITANGANTAAFGSTSDQRVKENIVNLPAQLDKIMALRPVEYDYIESYGGGHQIGFIAQEMQQVYPDVISEDDTEEKILSITGWSKTEARLVKAIQELNAKIEAQAAEIAALKGQA